MADKFHLIKNIQDRFIKVLSDHYGDYRMMVRTEDDTSEHPPCSSVTSIKTERSSVIADEKVDSRQTIFNEVKELQMKGFMPTITISKKLGISRQTEPNIVTWNFYPKGKVKAEVVVRNLTDTWKLKY